MGYSGAFEGCQFFEERNRSEGPVNLVAIRSAGRAAAARLHTGVRGNLVQSAGPAVAWEGGCRFKSVELEQSVVFLGGSLFMRRESGPVPVTSNP